MDKKTYDLIKDVRKRIKNNEPTTFAERNIVNMAEKKERKRKKSKTKTT